MSEVKAAKPALEPPFPRDSSLIAREDVAIPAAFNDSSPAARKLQPLRNTDTVAMDIFLSRYLDTSRYDSIRNKLWLIAVPGAPRPLYYQKLLRRDIVITEELDLHMVWAQSRILIKPLPDFLLNFEFWEEHVSGRPSLHRAACGLLYSYISLIRFPCDLQLAQQHSLVNKSLTYQTWTQFARLALSTLDTNNSRDMEMRFRYGELCLNRLDIIYRYAPQDFSISGLLRGFPSALSESYVPYMEQYNNAVSAFGVIIIVLSAFNLSLSARSDTPNASLQDAAYGFGVFAMTLCALLTAMFVVLPVISSLIRLQVAFVAHRHISRKWKIPEQSTQTE